MIRSNISASLIKSATSTPDKSAIVSRSETWTYAQLASYSINVCNQLKRLGVKCGDRVSVAASKDLKTYAWIHACLLAGAAYVPLDRSISQTRLQSILNGCQPHVVIADESTLKSWGIRTPSEKSELLFWKPGTNSAFEGAPFQTDTGSRYRFSEAMNALETDEKALAYLLYTSGTTGAPKGIAHSHASARAFIEWAAQFLSNKDRVAQISTQTFDLSIFDIFSTCYVGATLVPIPEHIQGFVGSALRFIVAHDISTIYCTPSFILRPPLHLVAKQLNRSSVRQIILAGERIDPNTLSALQRGLDINVSFRNWYGPTETNVCMHYDLPNEPWPTDQEVPIGRPCPFTKVVKPQIQETAGPAELIVHSSSQMLGIWPNIERSSQVNNETYSTGDLVKINQDQDYLFLGRNDRQIKRNGYRIQLEEVEAIAASLSSIDEAAAVYLETPNQPTLHLFLTPQQERTDFIIDRLLSDLPSYARPDEIHFLSKLPRTTRGKIDFNQFLDWFSSDTKITKYKLMNSEQG